MADFAIRGIELRQAGFGELGGWTADDRREALRAFQNSCRRIVAGHGFAGSARGNLDFLPGDALARRALCIDCEAVDQETCRRSFVSYFEPAFVEAEGRSLLRGSV